MLIRDLVVTPSIVGEALRDPHGASAEALAKARAAGVRLWLSAAAAGAYRSAAPSATDLAALAAGCQWLSALSSDVDVTADDPIATALRNGLARLGDETRMLGRHDGDLTPEALLNANLAPQPIAFNDLAAQQDRIRPDLERRIHAVLRHGHYIMGPEIAELEARLAAYVGVPHCITCASGTDSLEIAMRAIGIGPGDEVITVPFTWISTAETIAQVGATPVFVDIEPVGFTMDPGKLAAAITPRTKAIMPVSLFGQMADYETIQGIAGHIPVIEDGAQSFGATRHGRRSCGVTLVGSTSFFPAKPLGCYGDGGALFTADDSLAARMRAIRTHGGEKRHHHPYVGMNGRLDTIQAAILLAKLTTWDAEVAERQWMGTQMTAVLGGSTATPPRSLAGNTHVYAQYTVRLQARDAVAARLKADGVPTAVYYPKCLHEQPAFAGRSRMADGLEVAQRASREVLSLPMDGVSGDRLLIAARHVQQATSG